MLNPSDRALDVLLTATVHRERWVGRCATTGLTMLEFAERVNAPGIRADVPEWAQRAAVAICRSYGISGLCDPAYIANVITSHLSGRY